MVVSGLPAPSGRRRRARPGPRASGERRPRARSSFVDQEGGDVLDLRDAAAADGRGPLFESSERVSRPDRATGSALRRAGVDVDLAPVIDLRGGPLGIRAISARPALALAFARGLGAGGAAACVKHFPGLGTAPVSTDESPHVRAHVVPRELAAFRTAISAGIPCVMVGHASTHGLARGAPRSIRPLTGCFVARGSKEWPSPILSRFSGVATRSSARSRSARAGADLLLFTNGPDAGRVIRALVPLARRGLLGRARRARP